MSYYSYHGQIQKRIKNNELTGYEHVENYNKQGERLLLYFKTYPPIRPIRPERYDEYKAILSRVTIS